MYDREKMEIQEKAPPGAKYERMVKNIKKSFAKNGLTDKEKAIAYATTWKSYNKTHKEEKAMGELGEATRYAKETGINFRKQKAQPKGGTAKDDKAFQMVSKLMGSGRAGVQPRGVKKDKGGPTPGPSVTPTQKVEKRRASSERAKEMQSSRFDHFEMDGDNLQEKYLYTYLHERNYDALDKDMDGDEDFADVMIARMLASGKSREDAVKATMSKTYNKKGKKVKISDEFSDWRNEFGEEVSKKSPYCDIMPKNEGDDDNNNDTKAAKKRQKPNEGKVTAEGLEQFAEAMGGYLVEAEAEQLNELNVGKLGTAVKLAKEAQLAAKLAREAKIAAEIAKSSKVVKGPKAFVPPTPKTTPKPAPKKPGTKPNPVVVPEPIKVPTPKKPGTKPQPQKTPTQPGTKPQPQKTPTQPGTKPQPQTKPEPQTQTKTKTQTRTQIQTKVATLLQPLLKPAPVKTPIPTKGGSGGPKPPRGGSGPGGIPLPKIGLSDIIGKVGYTQNPQ